MHRVWLRSRLRNHLRAQPAASARIFRPIAIALTFNLICLTWCFFRLTALGQSLACLRSCFVFEADKLLSGGAADLSLWLLLGIYGATMLAAHWLNPVAEAIEWSAASRRAAFVHGFAWGVAVAVLGLPVLLAPNGETPAFIYFQF